MYVGFENICKLFIFDIKYFLDMAIISFKVYLI